MLAVLMNYLRACWRPSSDCRYVHSGSDAVGRQDGLLWYKDFGQHVNGEFSMAVVQANNLLEDQSQIESGPLSSLDSGPYGTFVGVYDGHGGPETSRYITDHLFQHLKRFASEQHAISAEVIRKAYQATEEGFLSLVAKQWPVKPQIAAVGSCCLVGIICSGNLYVANVGDSRVVMGRLVKATGEVLAVQLSAEHNASIESVRQELRALHPEDSQIVVLKHNVWRVKGLIQVSRSIGDTYLKKAEYNREPLYAKFRLREPFKKPILSSEPSISVHPLQPLDQFLIFASDGLWEHLSNQQAIDIVNSSPRSGCDGSVLLNSTQQNSAEKDGPPNISLHAFYVIDRAKKAVESSCPGVVSCADILALAARDAVALSGGPNWKVPVGRKDGRISRASDTRQLPPPTANFSQLRLSFAQRGLSIADLVALSGGHTLGFAHCSSFQNRIHNFNQSVDVDPSLSSSFAAGLRKICLAHNKVRNAGAGLDSTATIFDNAYFKLLLQGKSLFSSDQALLTNPRTKQLITQFASSQANFNAEFVKSMVKMGSLKGGKEVRLDCRIVR